jgi:hypothetical protein
MYDDDDDDDDDDAICYDDARLVPRYARVS